jgi:hypothetical protein
MNSYWTKMCVNVPAMLPMLAATLILTGCVVERPPRRVYVEQQPQPVYVEQQPPPPVYVQQQPPPPVYVQEPPPNAIVVTEAPPPPRMEVESPMPGPDFIWVQGYWTNDRGAWIWIGGQWQHPPHPGARFEPDRWQPVRGGYVRVQGGWR